ncbi:hypothetical protein FIV00_25645 [Labrenzia sp. THAF82]|uniref:DUF1467 family protein n=1 Tax=Labrenzia sp. THAF82 TaxID=2587861 RepID=UPI001269545D|nr:DUF1467 family protein [Labrenzia sp. THAF82]QFT33905.1 hypothetical protein FIV00_25645 [Labrenzia sp. THAF82]
MSVTLSIALFFMIWWIVLFGILPFGIKRSQEEAGDVIPGTAESAPDQPLLWRVIILTTVVTCILFGAYSWMRASDFSLDDIPFFVPPSLSSEKH